MWYTFVRFLRTVQAGCYLIHLRNWIPENVSSCSIFIITRSPMCNENQMATCKLFRSNHSPDRPNCIHWEHMLLPMSHLGLDGSEHIRPAVIEDHPNKGMTMTMSKMIPLIIVWVLPLSSEWPHLVLVCLMLLCLISGNNNRFHKKN